MVNGILPRWSLGRKRQPRCHGICRRSCKRGLNFARALRVSNSARHSPAISSSFDVLFRWSKEFQWPCHKIDPKVDLLLSRGIGCPRQQGRESPVIAQAGRR